MKKKKSKSVQEWIPIYEIMENGIIKTNKTTYIKILKIKPINFNLKSQLEKDAILNSYKIFLKTCDFDLQILIQSNKENLSNHILQIEKQIEKEENKNIFILKDDYIKYIQKMNKEKKSSSKNFYIILRNLNNNISMESIHNEKLIIEELKDKYFKIKECLFRCGNLVTDCNEKQEITKVIYSFFNKRLYINEE